MNTFGDRLKSARKEIGLTQQALAKVAGISQATVADIERGRNKGSTESLQLAKALKVSPDWLATGKGSRELSNIANEKNYPRVVGTARMGDFGYYLELEGSNGHIEFESEQGAIAILVRGDSMHPAIRDGWYVIIEPSGSPTVGEYVLLEFTNGKKMVKELLMEKQDCYVVMSVNSGERITVMREELLNIRAISAVVPPSKHTPTLSNA